MSDQYPELSDDIFDSFPFYYIKIQIFIFRYNVKFIRPFISDIKSNSARIVNKNSKRTRSVYNNKIMGSIQRKFLFRMIRIISTITYILISPFIYAPVCLTKTIYRIFLLHLVSEALFRLLKIPKLTFPVFICCSVHYRSRRNRISIPDFADHVHLLLPDYFMLSIFSIIQKNISPYNNMN